MLRMALLNVLATIFAMLGFVLRGLGRGLVAVGRGVGKAVRGARHRGGGGEAGMMRLLDLHAASIAGDTLVAVGLAGTIFFSVPAGEARGRVALYLLVTMLPFAVLAPVVGPLLDRFRHGRRYALATTFLGRAFLAYLISEHVSGLAVYPAAFGILVLSRAYGVARSAAVPRLLPRGLLLSEASARASVFGTVAGAVVAPVGIACAAWFGQQWPLRLAMLAFGYGMVTALRLPPHSDSEPPETVPRMFQLPGRKGAKVLAGRLVVATVAGASTLRALFGFLAVYLAFSLREGRLPTGAPVREAVAIGMVAVALGVGSFLGTAVGTALHIHRPALLQAGGIVLATAAAALAAWRYSLGWVLLLCLFTAMAGGLAKLTVDAVIQERVEDRARASAFAHAETLLMLAWVAGAALGLVPFHGRWGLIVAAAILALLAGRAVWSAVRLRKERLHGSAPIEPATQVLTPPLDATTLPPRPPTEATPATQPRRRWGWRRAKRPQAPAAAGVPAEPAAAPAPVAAPAAPAAPEAPPAPEPPTIPQPREPEPTRVRRPAPTKVLPAAPDTDEDEEPPGFHLYRPSSLGRDE
jgi:hypothetical protein